MPHHFDEPIAKAWQDTALDEEDRLIVAMNNLLKGDGVAEAVSDLLKDEAMLIQVAKQSFLHPTGASKLVLTRLGPEMPELRLHCWPQAVDRDGNEYSIHNHRWSFCSRVLIGSLRHETFEEDDVSGSPHFGVNFIARPEAKVYEVSPIQNKRLSRSRQDTLGPGDQYYLSGSRLHRMTNPRPDTAVTLFLRGPYRSVSTTVYHEREQAIITGQYPSGLEPSHAADLLAWIARGAKTNAGRPVGGN